MAGLFDDAVAPYTGPQQPDASSLWGLLTSLFGSGQPGSASLPNLMIQQPRDTILPQQTGGQQYLSQGPPGPISVSQSIDPSLVNIPGTGAREAYRANFERNAPYALAMGTSPMVGEAGPAGVPGILAYHGSPHDFSQFDISKIGTGQGAQTYSRGLYFSEAEPVAMRYREDLAGPPTHSLLGPDGQPIATGSPTQLGLTMGERLRGVVQPEAPYLGNSIGQLWAEGKPINVESVAESAWGGLLDTPEMRTTFENANPNWKAGVQEAIDRTKPVLDQHQIQTTQPGHMYQANLNINPEQLLDWDKPLSEQSDKVSNAIADLYAKHGIRGGNVSGSRAYQDLAQTLGSEEAATQALMDSGIPGVRYLDAGSRSTGKGTSNYVIYDDKLIDIIKKYGLSALIAGGGGAAGIAATQNGSNQPPGLL